MIQLNFLNAQVEDTGSGLIVNGKELSDIISAALGTIKRIPDRYDYISEKDLTNQYSFKDAMDYLKGIRVDKIEGRWILTKMTKNTNKICNDLGIIIQSPENDEDSLK